MSHTTSTRILVVDNDPLMIKALSDTLQGEGHTVVAAQGGQAGLEAFHSALNAQEPFSVVITDLAMDQVDGRQVATTVKSLSPDTPVILLTGWGQWFEAKVGLPLPVDCVLGKPLKLQDLRGALSRCLESHRP